MSARSRASSRMRLLSILAVLAPLGYAFAIKCALFNQLEYLGDVFSSLQMSRSFAEGRPLLYENGYGMHAGLHNYYIVPLFFPLTSWMGARGLFLGLFALWAAAAFRLVSHCRETDVMRRRLAASAAVALLLGPIAFWLLDDPLQGWHAELLFLPLGILFALDLRDGKRRAWLWAGLIVLVREEGAVLAWALHALHVMTEPGRETSPKRRLAILTSGWLAVFTAGLVLLLLNERLVVGPGRLPQAISHALALGTDPEIRGPLVAGFGGALVLLAAGALVALAGVRWRMLAPAALVALPIAAVQAVGSLTYLGPSITLSGPSWPPRFVLSWTVLVVAMVFEIERAEAPLPRSRRAAVALVAVVLSVAAQAAALHAVRAYGLLARLSPGNLASGPELFARRFTTRELDLVRCLGRRLTPGTTVLTNLSLFAPFDRQDLVWPGHPENAFDNSFPRISACDLWGRTLNDGCLKGQAALPGAGFSSVRVDGLSVVWGAGLDESVRTCLVASSSGTGPP